MSFFRSFVRKLGPDWLVKDQLPAGTEVDSRVLWAISLVLDAQLQRVREGILARFPGPAGAKSPATTGAPDDALHLIGRDRLIRRGPVEPVANYVARLQRSIDDHRVRGNAWALLEQIQGFLAPRAAKVALVNEHGNFYTLAADGTRTRVKATSWDWDGSDLVDAWARAWVIIYSEDGIPFDQGPGWGDPAQWGGAWGTPGYTWGSSATTDDVLGVQQFLPDWIMAGSRIENVIISFDDSDFDPEAGSPPLPDGTWGDPTARNPDARYWKGTGP